MNCIDPAPTVQNAPDFKQIKRITGGVFRSDLFYSYLFRFQEKQRRSAALYQIARSTLPDLRQLVVGSSMRMADVISKMSALAADITFCHLKHLLTYIFGSATFVYYQKRSLNAR